MYKGILMVNKLHGILFSLFFVTSSRCFGGQLPEGFKFEPVSDTHRTSIISQLQRFEDCHGDEICINRLKELENSVLVVISSQGRITVQNNGDSSVFVALKNEDK